MARKTTLKKKPGKALSANELDQWMMCFSHEFGSPLNSILTFSDALIGMNDGSLADDSLELLSLIHTDGTRLLRLVEKTILLMDMETKTSAFHIRPVPLMETFNMAVEAINSNAFSSSLKTAFPKKLDVLADRTGLGNLVREVLENAAMHGLIGKPIRGSARSAGRNVEVTVTNSMPPEHRADPKKVFGKFIQGNMNDPASKPPGMGIGLTICKLIAKAFRGKIICKRPSKGRWVTVITIPKATSGGTR